MNKPLAIFTNAVGLRSETFISRHINDLLPGRCVVVANQSAIADRPISAPVLTLDQLPRERLRHLVFRRLLEQAGIRLRSAEKLAVKRFLRQYGVKVVLGEYLNTFVPWLDFCASMGIRTYVHAHGYDVSMLMRKEQWRNQFKRYCLADGVITVSRLQQKRVLELGVDARKVHLIPYGVTVPGSLPERRPPDGIIRCLAVGRMVAKKAPILCLDAFRRAAEQVPALRLDYIGEGILLSSARQYVEAMELGDKVILHGGLDNVYVQQFLRNADIFMLCSLTDEESGDEEGLPVCILEAMAQGLPIISTHHAGIPDAVVDGETGLLAAEGDLAGLSANLIKLASDDHLRRQMGMAAYHRAKAEYTWERNRDRLLQVMGLADQGIHE